MARVSRFTPLAELSAVVLDTETTGLEVASCRLVQVSAVRFAGGEPLPDQTFDRLVRPGVPIPPAATAVHGITDAMVAAAPDFAAVKPAFDAFVDGAVLVGQSIGFDLAVLLHETERIGAEWRPPQFLDTKLLAAALDPAAPELDLDALAARLGVPVADRHRALGDALVTAAIFAALLPRLATAGVRTLGDAEARANAQLRLRARQAEAGWYDVTTLRPTDPYEAGRDAGALARLDALIHRHRVEHLMSPAPQIVAPATTLADAVRLMAAEARRALLAGDPASGRVDGIVTQGDVLAALARDGAAALARRLETIMSAPVAAVPRDAFVYRAVARMQRLGIGQLPVQDSGRRVVGMLSLRDLLHTDTGDAVALSDRLSTAPTPRALGAARAELPALARRLLADDVPAVDVAAVLAAELRELLARVAAMAEQRMQSEGSGRPPVAYAVLALDRIGRGECSLAGDAAHALVYASGAPDSLEARWFDAFAAHFDDCLRAAGVPAAVRAVDPSWRRSFDGWRAALADWTACLPGGGLAAFFDFRLAYGDDDLAEDLRTAALDAAAAAPALLRALTPQPLPAATGPARLDIAGALAPIEALARALAVAARLPALATGERLAEACSRTGLSRPTADELTERHERLLAVLLDAELRQLEAGVPIGGPVDPATLDADAVAQVEAALQRAAGLADIARLALALV